VFRPVLLVGSELFIIALAWQFGKRDV
jgi:hypothetical protein